MSPANDCFLLNVRGLADWSHPSCDVPALVSPDFPAWMSIFYICGKPRGGKSFQAVRAICQELADKHSQRLIVTNLPLKFDDYEREYMVYPGAWAEWRFRLRRLLQLVTFGKFKAGDAPRPEKKTRIARGLKSWCADNAPHVTSLRERIRILTDDETGEFWLYEPGWTYDGRKTIKQNRRGCEMDVPDFTYKDGTARGDSNNGNPGTLYVIDEIHLFFPSRAWQKTGEDATFFLSQHGKFKCDVIMITQHPEQCDKALRRLAQEYMTVRNLSREPVLGFRIGNLFRVNRMLNSPQSPNPAVFDSQFVSMDFRTYGDLYDTSAGVGVAGTLVPNVEKRGRSLLWLLVPIGIIGYVAFHPGFMVKGVTWVTNKMFHQLSGNVLTSMGAKMPGTLPEASPAGSGPAHVQGGIQGLGQRLLVPAIVEATGGQASPARESGPAVKPAPAVTNIAWLVSQPEDTNLVQVTGWLKEPDGSLRIFLSNGRELPSWMVAAVSDSVILLKDGSHLMMALPSSGGVSWSALGGGVPSLAQEPGRLEGMPTLTWGASGG
jgi:hypothetical protein